MIKVTPIITQLFNSVLSFLHYMITYYVLQGVRPIFIIPLKSNILVCKGTNPLKRFIQVQVHLIVNYELFRECKF